MSLSLHTAKSIKTVKPSKRRGRGLSSGRGKYSGRGMKGQRSRSGGKGGLKLKGMKANIQNIPKLPGFKSNKPKLATINLSVLEISFKNGDKVTANILKKMGLIETTKNGLKILGDGKLSKKLIIIADKASATALTAVESSGGTLKLIAKTKIKDKRNKDTQKGQPVKKETKKKKQEKATKKEITKSKK